MLRFIKWATVNDGLPVPKIDSGFMGISSQSISRKTTYNVNDMLLEMATLPDRKPFWKGLTIVAALYDDSLNPRSVVKQLLRDGIISGKIPVQRY